MNKLSNLTVQRAWSQPVWTYLGLLAVGVIVPFSQFIPWVYQHGFDVPLFFQQLFSNPIGAFAGLDVIVAVLALIATAALNIGNLTPLQRALVVMGSLLGVSVGLPIYLLLMVWNKEYTEN